MRLFNKISKSKTEWTVNLIHWLIIDVDSAVIMKIKIKNLKVVFWKSPKHSVILHTEQVYSTPTQNARFKWPALFVLEGSINLRAILLFTKCTIKLANDIIPETESG